jgi:hypothetical protein
MGPDPGTYKIYKRYWLTRSSQPAGQGAVLQKSSDGIAFESPMRINVGAIRRRIFMTIDIFR